MNKTHLTQLVTTIGIILIAGFATALIGFSTSTGANAAPPQQGGQTPRVYLPLLVRSSGSSATATSVSLTPPVQTSVPSTTPVSPPPPSSGAGWSMLAAN